MNTRRVLLSAPLAIFVLTACATEDPASVGQGAPVTAVVSDVVGAVDGDDLVPDGGEYVVVENRATIPIDMGGWSVRVRVGDAELRLGVGRKIELGAKVKVFTACGTAGDTCRTVGGTVTLVGSAGTEVSQLKYG